MTDKQFTITGTDIEEVKKQNSASGLTYNQVKQLLQQHYKEQQTSSIISQSPTQPH
ncbi:MAG: hypothetical protein ACI35P_10935 [Bacillus sp. (in: firmicutes)]